MSFVDEARRAFSFLVGMGFQVTVCDESIVRYENKMMRASVVWDPRSGELDVMIHPRVGMHFQSQGYSLSRLLKMQNADRPEAKMPFQVPKEDKLGKFLDILADDLRRYGQPALGGDKMFLRRLSYYRDPEEQAFARAALEGGAREQAAKAWFAHDYEGFIRCYERIKGNLSAAELAKLSYARKRTSHESSEDNGSDK